MRASDVWFTFSISSTDPHVLTLGSNPNDVHYMNWRSFGSGGTINDMSGPDEWIDDSWFVASMNITALYEYGVSKTSVTLQAPGGVVVLSPSPVPNTSPTTSPGPGATVDPILFYAIMLVGSCAVVASVFLERRARLPPT